MPWTLGEIAGRLHGRVRGDAGTPIRGVAGIREAGEGEITFLANPRYASYLGATRASAVILAESMEVAFPEGGTSALFVRDPYIGYLQVLQLFDGATPETVPPGIHPTAVVDPSARLGDAVAVGPLTVICEHAVVGDRTVLMAGCYIGPKVTIGPDGLFYPRVVVRKETEIGARVIVHSGAVLGDDGFGFAPDGTRYHRIPQIGRVVIEDDVDIGANTTIDRATTGATRIARGTKVDNLVMIAHNVEVGEDTIVCAQVGISGSTRIGRHVTLAGQAGLTGHITIWDDAKVGAQGGVTKSIPPNERYSGYPAQPHGRAQRAYAALRDLPEALRELRRLEKRVRALESRLKRVGEPPTDDGVAGELPADPGAAQDGARAD